jgi:hypothetical protein
MNIRCFRPALFAAALAAATLAVAPFSPANAAATLTP